MTRTILTARVTSKVLLCVGLLFVTALGATAVIGRRVLRADWPSVAPTALTLHASPPASAGREAPDRPAADMLRITLRPEGIQPVGFELTRGHFLLVVYNTTGLDDLSLRLEGGPGSAHREVRLPPVTGLFGVAA